MPRFIHNNIEPLTNESTHISQQVSDAGNEFRHLFGQIQAMVSEYRAKLA